MTDVPAHGTERPPADKERARHVTAAVVLGATAAALAVILTIALWPPARPNGLLSEIPTIPTVAPPAAELGGPGVSARPSPDGPPPTFVPATPPPLPLEPSSGPPSAPAPRTTPPRQPPPPPRLAAVSFEAESAANTLGGSARVHNNPEASNGHTIGGIGRGPANTVRFNGLGVPASGTYTLTVFYISGDGDRAGTIRVNGRLVGVMTFPGTGDWHTLGSLAVRINLGAGNNSIEFGNSDGPAPDIDRLTLAS
jgi:hypothetical protein